MSKAEYFWNSHFQTKAVLPVLEHSLGLKMWSPEVFSPSVTKKIENQILPDSASGILSSSSPLLHLHVSLSYTLQQPFCLKGLA